MEQNNSVPIEFIVISGDDKLIVDSVNSYNEFYNTDFKIVEFIYDEVVFAKIQVTKYKLSDIFALGCQFGGYIEFKRQKGEIDW